jgi:hypothetical protein
MLKYIYLSLTLLVLKVTCLFREGACPDLNYGNLTLDFNNILGRWYEVARDRNSTIERGLCAFNDLMMNDDGTFNFTITHSLPTGLEEIYGMLSPTSSPFRFNASLSSNLLNAKFPYHILSTDYKNYLVDYACVNVEGGRDEYFHIWFRNIDYSKRMLRHILDYLRDNFMLTEDMMDFTRINC